MLKRCVVPTMILAPMMALVLLLFAPLAGAQTGAKRESGKDIHRDGWDRLVPEAVKGQKSDPAPVHDLTGIWEPTPGYRDGVQATGAKENPSDGKHNLPFTPLGEQTWKSHKPGFGTTAVPIAQNNDPFDICDPIDFPRLELFNLRAIQVFQSKSQVAVIYQNIRYGATSGPTAENSPRRF
jgi:hypothetical protein